MTPRFSIGARWLCFSLAAPGLVLTACAHPSAVALPNPDMEITERSHSVEQKLLESPEDPGSYKMGRAERFLMPLLQQQRSPELPLDSPRTVLSPTTVCVRVVLNERGTVDSVMPLDDRAECHAGTSADNQDLMRAVQESVMQWIFSPAAICSWKAGSDAPLFGGCAGAESIRPVPVSLMYAFAFEIREGKRIVRRGP
jgi:hypothetical protein